MYNQKEYNDEIISATSTTTAIKKEKFHLQKSSPIKRKEEKQKIDHLYEVHQ